MKTNANTRIELFFDQLRDLHSMEDQLCQSMPSLVSFCSNGALRDLIVSHASQGCRQLAEIVSIFERHEESPGDDKCKAMEGLIQGGTAHLEGVRSPQTRDLMVIAHCLRVEYYEMAAYEFTTLLAGQLGMTREPDILSGLLEEERDMAAALMRLEPYLFESVHSLS